MWLSSHMVAQLAGISRQKAHAALVRGAWRGCSLVVRPVTGEGGKAGRSLQVRLDSLPSDVQSRFNDRFNEPSTHVEGSVQLAEWKAELIRPALAAPRGSKERARVVAELASKPFRRPNGKQAAPSARTINRWIEAYEGRNADRPKGFGALTRKKRADAGRKLACIYLPFDKWLIEQAGRAELEKATAGVNALVCGLHKNLTTPHFIKHLAQVELLQAYQHLSPPNGIINVPMHFINDPDRRKFRVNGKSGKDHKAFEDKNRPRISRYVQGMWPMAGLEGDGHHLDSFLGDRGEFQSYPKAICWLDVATKRLWMDVVFLRKGEGVRNEHVMRSFLNMCAAWGLPQVLRLDNGSEYNFANLMNDMLKLNSMGMRVELAGREGGVSRARPYNAPAKQIEGVFRQLERIARPFPGHVGGDRMKQTVSQVGRAPDAFTGDLAAFEKMMLNIVATYNSMAQGVRTQLKGLSPNQAYENAIKAGWQKTAVEPDAFLVPFSKEENRQLRQGRFSLDGHYWTCPELLAHVAEKIIVCIPKYSGFDRVAVKSLKGDLIGIAERDRAFAYLDPEGAKEAARRVSINRKAVRAHGRKAPNIDPVLMLERSIALLPAPPEAPVGAIVSASDEAKAIGAGLKESPKARRKREIEESERETRELLALGRDLNANLKKRIA